MTTGLNVLFVTAEGAPFVKIGGLGDVAGSLPHAIRSLPNGEVESGGIDIRMALPLYHVIDRERFSLKRLTSVEVDHANGRITAEIYETEVEGLPVYLIDGPVIPNEGPIYSTDAKVDAPKFTYVSLAALELVRKIGWKPHVLHAQDWHTAPAVYSLRLRRSQDLFFERTASLLTVHNLPYLGVGAGSILSDFGLPPAHGSDLPTWAWQLPLPLGLLTADHINTVSPGYAAEMMTPEFGSGLHEFLRRHREKLSGILNGLDLATWDPTSDENLFKNYAVENLLDRDANKAILQETLNLDPDPELCLFSMVTRMDNQKGIDIALEALRLVEDYPWQAIILGTGQADLEEAARNLQADYPERVRARIAFDAPLGHQIYGGADAILIPSRYEPCGLTQMIGMRYGCVPIARATGGLRDTILDYYQARGESTGFLFEEATPDAMAETLKRALFVWEDKRRWRGLQRRGMKQDFSWETSARKYVELYEMIVEARAVEINNQ